MKTRSVPMAEMSKTSLLPVTVPAPGVVVLPAGVTSWPMSRLRAVMTPSKGASMRSKDCSSSSRRTLACAEFTSVERASSCETALSVSCCETAFCAISPR